MKRVDFLKKVHDIICYVLIVLNVFNLLFVLYSKIKYSEVIYYGITDKYYQNYFQLLMSVFGLLEISLFSFLIIVFVRLIYDIESLKINRYFYFITFVGTIFLMLCDPFGLAKWLND